MPDPSEQYLLSKVQLDRIEAGVGVQNDKLDLLVAQGQGFVTAAEAARDAAGEFEDDALLHKNAAAASALLAQQAAGAAGNVDVAAINAALGTNYVAACWWDPMNDDEPGWIDKCEGLPWFNELGKPPRFGLVGVTTQAFDILDLTASTASIWCNITSSASVFWQGNAPLASVTYRNGRIRVAAKNNGDVGGLSYLNFPHDISVVQVNATSGYWPKSIKDRNLPSTSFSVVSSYFKDELPSRNVNSVRYFLEDGAPRDQFGLREPSALIGCGQTGSSDGVMVYEKYDGTMIEINASTAGGGYEFAAVDVTERGALIGAQCYNGDFVSVCVFDTLPTADTTQAYSPAGARNYQYDGTTPSLRGSLVASPSFNDLKAGGDVIAFAFSDRLTFLHRNPSDPTKDMVCYIGKDFNTGWFSNDALFVGLATTEIGTVSGASLSSSNLTDWQINTGSVTKAADRISWDGVTDGSIYYWTYHASFPNLGLASGGSNEVLILSFDVENYVAGRLFGSFSNGGVETDYVTANGSYTFRGRDTTGSNAIYLLTDQSFQGDIVNLQVTRASEELSHRGNHLEPVGNITRARHSVGGDAVFYGPFSGTNYFLTPAGLLDVGDDPLFVEVIHKGPDIYFTIADSRSSASSSDGGVFVGVSTTGSSHYMEFYTQGEGRQSLPLRTVGQDVVRHLCWGRDADGNTIMRENEVDLANGQTSTATINSGGNKARIGVRFDDQQSVDDGIALLRITRTTKTGDQISYTWDHEKQMFVEDAVYSLKGASANVVSIDYSERDGRFDVAQADVLNRFYGLVNVDHIAADCTNGMISEYGFNLYLGSTDTTVVGEPFNFRDLMLSPRDNSTRFTEWTSGTGSKTNFELEPGQSVKNVFVGGALQRPGSGEAYTIEYTGFREFVSFDTAPAAVSIGIDVETKR